MNQRLNLTSLFACLLALGMNHALAGEMVEIPGVMDDMPVEAQPVKPEQAKPEKPAQAKPEPPKLEPVRATVKPAPESAKSKQTPARPAEVQEIIPMPPAVRSVKPAQPEIEPRPAADTLERRTPMPPLPPSVPAPASPVTRQPSGRISLTDTIATLDNESISRMELYDAMVDTHGPEVFARIINRRLLRSEMKRRGFSISQAEIDSTFAEHMKRLQAGRPNKIDYARLLRYRYGITIREYKNRIVWVELALKKLMRNSLHITSGDVFNYYYAHRKNYSRPEEVRASHILISPATYAMRNREGAIAAGSIAWNKAFRVALQVQSKLRAGADFKELARRFSQDKRTAPHGGDVGYFARGRMLKPFEDAAFALKKGEISDLVKTTLGYHLIKVTDRVRGKLLPFSEVKARVRKDYESYLLASQSSDLLERIKRTAIQQGRLKIIDPDLRREP